MVFIISAFEELSVRQLYLIYELRSRVFVVEQNCAYQDVDEKDLKAIHVMMFENEALLGYCRILPPGVSYPEVSVGRVVVSHNQRGSQKGRVLMNKCLEICRTIYGNQDIVISAQSYLQKFYSSLGFLKVGEEYLEDNIPHIQMRSVKSVSQ